MLYTLWGINFAKCMSTQNLKFKDTFLYRLNSDGKDTVQSSK